MSDTTIKVSMATRDALKAIGKMGDSYDQVLRLLIKHWKERSP